MKRFFTLISVLAMTAVMVLAQSTYTVAGASAIVNGDVSWDQTNAANDMTSDDGVNYTLVVTGAVLKGGTVYEYKVTADHAWNQSWPATNAQLKVDEDGTYTITYTYKVGDEWPYHTTEKTGEAVIGESSWTVIGTIVGNWDVDTEMTKGDDGLLTATFTDVATGNYEFKIRADKKWDEAYPASNYTFSVDADNSTVKVSFNATTHDIAVDVTNATAISAIEQAATTDNAARYNLQGQRVGNGYRGIVMLNGRKYIAK